MLAVREEYVDLVDVRVVAFPQDGLVRDEGAAQLFAETLLEYGLVGKGTACHARAAGLYPAPAVSRLIDLARAAQLGFVTDPHTGPLHLPVREFRRGGVPVALGQDDIEDAYYRFGRHNLLKVAFLAALLARLSRGRRSAGATDDDHRATRRE